MNVIVAVVVESTLERAICHQADALKAFEAQQTKAAMKLDEVFAASDDNNDGKITRDEFAAALQRDEVREYLKEAGFDLRQAHNLFDILDYDDSGALSAEEFTNGLLKARGEARARDVLTIQCQLWKGEARLRMELQDLCLTVDSRMDKVDKQVRIIRRELEMLGSSMGMDMGHVRSELLPQADSTSNLTDVEELRHVTHDDSQVEEICLAPDQAANRPIYDGGAVSIAKLHVAPDALEPLCLGVPVEEFATQDAATLLAQDQGAPGCSGSPSAHGCPTGFGDSRQLSASLRSGTLLSVAPLDHDTALPPVDRNNWVRDDHSLG